MKTLAKNILGNILITVRPQKATELSKKGMTLVIDDELSFTERLIRSAILRRTEEIQDFETLAEYHRNYWVNQGTEYFSSTDNHFETVFLPDCSFIFDLLEKRLENNPNQFNTLVEIGTGNGNVLNYLSLRYPSITRFIGIDLSNKQTKINQDNYKQNQSLEFVAADGFDWVNKNGVNNTIFVTSRGVLEYFTQTRLQAFFNKVNSLDNIIFIAIEPNSLDHDFSINPNSKPYGSERSFSHNYAKLFENANFKLWHQSKKEYPTNGHSLSFFGAQNQIE